MSAETRKRVAEAQTGADMGERRALRLARFIERAAPAPTRIGEGDARRERIAIASRHVLAAWDEMAAAPEPAAEPYEAPQQEWSERGRDEDQPKPAKRKPGK